MIGLLAVRELDGDLRPGDVVQQLFIHAALLADEPALRAVRQQATTQVTEHPATAVTDTTPICTYVFSPAYIDAVMRRNINPVFDNRSYPHLGTVVALWRRPEITR